VPEADAPGLSPFISYSWSHAGSLKLSLICIGSLGEKERRSMLVWR
jgi:hypothetical protein